MVGPDFFDVQKDLITLEGLEIECIIGIFDWERKTKQKVSIDFRLECDICKAGKSDNIDDTVDYKKIAKAIITLVEPSSFYLIEKMAEEISKICLYDQKVSKAIITVSKPGAVRGSKNVSVTISREKGNDLYLGIGGNIEPGKHIKNAMKLLSEHFGEPVAISPVYQSTAYGVTEPQEDYLNLVARFSSSKELFTIRAQIRWIEELTGRKRTLDKFAPRPIDIDLLLYGDTKISDEAGKIPHEQILTQQFVYLPLLDISPELVLPRGAEPISEVTPVYADPELAIRKVSESYLDI